MGIGVAALAAVGPMAASGAALAAPPGVAAARQPVLVELFTSQGCSSCPAADALVRELPRLGLGRDRVVPLTFHVDYWDELGWKDPFASPAFTDRQRHYVTSGKLRPPAGQGGIDGAYTPQMIVAGRVHFSGGRRDLALAEIARAAARPTPWELAVSAEAGARADQVVVAVRLARVDHTATSPQSLPRSWALLVALATSEERTQVARGENAGRALDEAAVVRVLSPPVLLAATTPDADGRVRISLPRPPGLGGRALDVIAFVQATDNGEVIATGVAPSVNLRVGATEQRPESVRK
jgi:hypothetical protein